MFAVSPEVFVSKMGPEFFSLNVYFKILKLKTKQTSLKTAIDEELDLSVED